MRYVILRVVVPLLIVVLASCSNLTEAQHESVNEQIARKNAQMLVEHEEELRVNRILVTGGDVSIPYKLLGPVHADTEGEVSLGALLTDALVRSPLAASLQATPTADKYKMYKMLRKRALSKYGDQVDAIINATYSFNSSGDSYADGIAVHFMTEPSTSAQGQPNSPEPQREQ